MINKISDEKIDWLVKSVVGNEHIFNMKPIFAGGSMLSVYRAYKFFSSEERWNTIKRAEDKGLLKQHLDEFGDIDFWFFKDHEQYTSLDFSWLLKDKSNFKLEDPLKESHRAVSSSSWANSFRDRDGKSSILQAIKSPIESVSDLFSKFDFKNCCVAYHDGVLYYDSDIDKLFCNFNLDVNNGDNYTSESMPQRIYAGLRAFKYAKRYMLDFSEVLSEHIFAIYRDLDSIDYTRHDQKVCLDNDVYGSVLIASSDFMDMVYTFKSNFPEFSKMKTFKDEYILFLLDRNDLKGVKSFLGETDDYIKIPF